MSSMLRRLRDRMMPRLSSDARQLLILFNQLADERNKLLQDLRHAAETIDILDSQLAEYDCLLQDAQSRLAERTDFSKPRLATDGKPQLDTNTGLGWIEDTWLCSCHNSTLLREAEDQWKGGRPQQALITASRTLSTNSNLELADELECRLFIAALVHHGGKYEESNERVDSALEMIQEERTMNFAQAREVRAIAHFIRGKNLMGLEEWNLAYWAFLKALYTPGYHAKAQDFQKMAIANCKRGDTADE